MLTSPQLVIVRISVLHQLLVVPPFCDSTLYKYDKSTDVKGLPVVLHIPTTNRPVQTVNCRKVNTSVTYDTMVDGKNIGKH